MLISNSLIFLILRKILKTLALRKIITSYFVYIGRKYFPSWFSDKQYLPISFTFLSQSLQRWLMDRVFWRGPAAQNMDTKNRIYLAEIDIEEFIELRAGSRYIILCLSHTPCLYLVGLSNETKHIYLGTFTNYIYLPSLSIINNYNVVLNKILWHIRTKWQAYFAF